MYQILLILNLELIQIPGILYYSTSGQVQSNYQAVAVDPNSLPDDLTCKIEVVSGLPTSEISNSKIYLNTENNSLNYYSNDNWISFSTNLKNFNNQSICPEMPIGYFLGDGVPFYFDHHDSINNETYYYPINKEMVFYFVLKYDVYTPSQIDIYHKDGSSMDDPWIINNGDLNDITPVHMSGFESIKFVAQEDSISYFNINMSTSGESHICFNGHDQNLANGIVVLDEQGNLPSSSTENLIKSNQSNSVTSGFNLNFIENNIENNIDHIKQTIYSANNISFYDILDIYRKYNIISISGISIADYLVDGPENHINISPEKIELYHDNESYFSFSINNGLRLYGHSTNTPSGLVVLDQNGFIIDDQLLQVKVNDYTQEKELPTEYEISGGIYQCFTIIDDEGQAQFTRLKLTTPNNDEHYTNENKYGFIRFYCGSDLISLEFPPKARLLNIPSKFKSGNLYLIKYLRNTFEIFQMKSLEISDDYIIGPGITIECEEGEVFSNVTVQEGGQLKFAATSATLNDLTVESGGKLEYVIESDYDPVNYSLLQGSNTNIASGTIMLYDQVADGYCSNGVFYELDGLYRIAIGSNMSAIEPKISYGVYSTYNEETEETEYVSYGARVYGFNGAIISGASIGMLGDINTYFGAIATNTVLGGYSGERSACELTVWSGGTAINTIVSSNGYLNATYDGYVNSAVVYSGGSCTIHTNNDKVNDNIIVMPYGYYRQHGSYTISSSTYYSNTIVNSLTISAGSGSSGANVIIHSGGTVNNLALYKEGETLDNGQMCRIYGGYVSNIITINENICTYPALLLNSNGYINNISIWEYDYPINITINSGTINNYEKSRDHDQDGQNNDIVIIRNGTINTYKHNFGSNTIISGGGLINNASCYYAQSVTVVSNGSIGTLHLHNPEYDGLRFNK